MTSIPPDPLTVTTIPDGDWANRVKWYYRVFTVINWLLAALMPKTRVRQEITNFQTFFSGSGATLTPGTPAVVFIQNIDVQGPSTVRFEICVSMRCTAPGTAATCVLTLAGASRTLRWNWAGAIMFAVTGTVEQQFSRAQPGVQAVLTVTQDTGGSATLTVWDFNYAVRELA